MKPQISTGTVSEFSGTNGLLKALTDFVVGGGVAGRDWTLEFDQNAKDSDGVTDSHDAECREVILSNTGVSEEESIIIGIREYKYPAGNEYGWELNGYLAVPSTWNGAAEVTHGLSAFGSARHHWTYLPQLQLFDSEIAYWFYATKEFIQVAVRIGTSYFECYLGNGRRLGSPSEYPYPLVVAGSGVGEVSYQDGGNGPVRPLSSGTYRNLFCVDPSGVFKTGDGNLRVLPMEGESSTASVDTAPNGDALLLPAFYLVDENQVVLQLFNMFVFRKVNAQNEATYTESSSGRKFRTFAQGKNDYDYDFLAILEEVSTTTTTTTTWTTSTTTTNTYTTTSTSTTSTTTT